MNGSQLQSLLYGTPRREAQDVERIIDIAVRMAQAVSWWRGFDDIPDGTPILNNTEGDPVTAGELRFILSLQKEAADGQR